MQKRIWAVNPPRKTYFPIDIITIVAIWRQSQNASRVAGIISIQVHSQSAYLFNPRFRSIGEIVYKNGREKVEETKHGGEKARCLSRMEWSFQFRYPPSHSTQNSSSFTNETFLWKRKETVDWEGRDRIDVKRRSGRSLERHADDYNVRC